MDEARRFRFLIPPFFLAVSVSIGLYFSNFDFTSLVKPWPAHQLVLLTAIVGASSLPVGFLLTSISILGLRIAALLVGNRTYEAVLPGQSWERIRSLVQTRLPLDACWHLYAAATFDHELLSSEVHEWIQRRWTTFNLSVHSCAGIALSHFAALRPEVRESWPWVLITIGLLLLFLGNAAVAWRQTMRMLEFQSSREAAVFSQSTAG